MHGRAETFAAKRELLDNLLLAWNDWPEMRLGQLLFNALWSSEAFHNSGLLQQRLWSVEDVELLQKVQEMVAYFGYAGAKTDAAT